MLGNLTERDDSRLGADRYRYDPLGRIVAHTDPAQTLRHFVYDRQGDRFHHQHANERGRQVQHDNGARWWLDAAGQLTERHDTQTGVQRFTWDAFGRLAEFENTRNEKWAYRYDALGRRIGKVALDGPGTERPNKTRTCFLWDSNTMAGEMRQAHSKNEGRFYAYHLKSFVPLTMQTVATDEVTTKTHARMFYYQNDPNGAPVKLRAYDGQIVWEAHYGVTGAVDFFETHSIDQPIRLQGQYADNESGLRYNRYRYFDPATGSFVSQDPIGLLGGGNPYQFAFSTVGWIDPLGLRCAHVDEEKTLHIKNQFEPGSAEDLALRQHVADWNAQIEAAGGSMTRQSVTKEMRAAANTTAESTRKANPELYPAGVAAGHTPDVGWGGAIEGPIKPLNSAVNAYVGGATQAVPVGTTYNQVVLD
ncbi:YD repeat-containing protein [Caballeronia turbans]|nr:YD repeat-containing protein [Caballeronia turbans]